MCYANGANCPCEPAPENVFAEGAAKATGKRGAEGVEGAAAAAAAGSSQYNK